MDFVAGIDGGGTKTECVLLGLDGKALAVDRFGSMNLNRRPAEEVEATLEVVAKMIMAQPGECRMAVIGCAGTSNAALQNTVEKVLRQSGYNGPYKITGDQNIALYAAHGGAPGAVLISGTGSICFGVGADGREVRVGGWGYKVDDEGSGYAIGRDILGAVLRAFDGRGPKTVLMDLVAQRLGTAEPNELIHAIYGADEEKANLPSYAQLLTPALEAGDEAAEAILQKAVEELCLLASTALKRLGLPKGPLAFSGGMILHSQALADGLTKGIQTALPGVSCFPLMTSAAMGAARMAFDELEK